MKYILALVVLVGIAYLGWNFIQTKPDPSVEQAIITDSVEPLAEAPVQQPTVASEQVTTAPTTTIDNQNVKVAFKGFGPGKEHIGGFSGVQSALTLTPAGSIAGKVTIDMNTLSSDNDRLTTHLKNEDFFDVVKYPSATFVVTSASNIVNNAGTLTGNLTVHGVTKSVTIPYRFDTTSKQYNSTFTIDMKAFGIEQTFANEVVEVTITVPVK